jgi:pyridoxal phosphate enzyme (YggS family)
MIQVSDLVAQLAENVARVRRRITEAAARSGRSAEQVSLVAVTKYVGPDHARALVQAGCDLLGESRPQQLWEKAEALQDLPIRWHMIGHLQRNKVRRTLPLVQMIESVDSPRLVETADRIAGELSRRVPILLEVNVSGETAKHGFPPEAVEPFLEELPGYRNVEVRGLMCMAAWGGGPEDARGDFARLRELRDRLERNCPQGVSLNELSMGMSGDYPVAIEEGATIVRVGSALFEGVLG